MVKCPFCQYDNEDGALFCDQCKSDLGIFEAAPSPPSLQGTEISNPTVADPAPVAKVLPIPDAPRPVPMAAPVHPRQPPDLEDIPVASAVLPAQPIPVARAVDAPVAAVASATPVPSKEFRREPPPTVPVPIQGDATFSSLETYTAPSKASSTPSTPDPTAPRAKDTDVLPIAGKPRLLVLRGQRVNVEYPLYEGENFIGRADERPVDIDLEDQELPDRIWSSRQHALIRYENGVLVIEDLNSSNGTFINRSRLYPGQKRVLMVNDIIQIGTVQMKVVSSP